MLFLLFNCVCTAAPVLKLTNENYKDSISIRLIQVPAPLENEEEGQAVSAYLHCFNSLSVRKQSYKAEHQIVNTRITSFRAIDLPKTYIADTSLLPMPGNRAFLFRYNLF